MVALFLFADNTQQDATPGINARGFFHAQVIEHMSDIQAYVQRVLEEAPALTEEKRDKLTQLFGGC